MANTFSKIYVQVVFSVKHRQSLIREEIRDELQQYISGIIKNRGQQVIAIFCMPDHVHILIYIRPAESLSSLVRDIKAGSSGFINEKKWIKGTFRWQEGYGIFSYAERDVDRVKRYILNQAEHHRRITFREEYLSFLNDFKITYDEKYVFEQGDQNVNKNILS